MTLCELQLQILQKRWENVKTADFRLRFKSMSVLIASENQSFTACRGSINRTQRARMNLKKRSNPNKNLNKRPPLHGSLLSRDSKTVCNVNEILIK